MFRILDRYVIRELVLPITLSLVVLTFILVVPTILRDAEELIAKGIAWGTIAHVLVLLLPSALSLTIPMAVLLGILIGFGRLSADREFVAMQACGVSVYRLIRPLAIVAAVGMAADAYEIIVALPSANQTYREIAFNVVASRAESNVKPRVFFDDFPNHTIYAKDVVNGAWRDVFLADTSHPDETTVYFAKDGRLVVNREKRTVSLELEHGTRYTMSTRKPEDYERGEYSSLVLQLNPDSVFRQVSPAKTVTEMTIAELRASRDAAQKQHDPGNSQTFMIQQKFAIPVASLVLALMGLALGVSHQKDGRLASFVLGFAVIFVYYVVLWTARAGAITGRFPAALAPWLPNAIFTVVGVALLLVRSRSADKPIRLEIPAFWRRRRTRLADDAIRVAGDSKEAAPPARPIVLIIRIPYLDLPRPSLLDLYVSRQYLRIFALGVVSLLGIFYISTFMDLADKLFRGAATSAILLRYLYVETPQYIYYIIPMAALVAALVTIGLMTKNSELIVMRACGISLYRTAAPLLLFGVVLSGVLFGLEERVLALTNREADFLIRIIRGFPPRSFGALDRRWMVGANGDIYHYELFDAAKNEFSQFAVYRPGAARWDLRSVTRASRVALDRPVSQDDGSVVDWKGFDGWSRDFSQTTRRNVTRTVVKYAAFTQEALPLESPAYFKTDEPDAALMTYGELKDYVERLQTGGYNTTPYLVSLQRKIAFPFVTVVMTLLAVPFAVTTGRRGALYGVGVGIVLAIAYWLMLSVFAAVGAGGLLPPLLAAWAPNCLFGAVAIYLLLTVRT
jgi:LPS export ABC transporter permease LptF/LPS export ABC transporter permease LptG